MSKKKTANVTVKKSQRLFFRKYLYRVILKTPFMIPVYSFNGNNMKNQLLNRIWKNHDALSKSKKQKIYLRASQYDRREVEEANFFLNDIVDRLKAKEDMRLRSEGKTSIFTNDRKLVDFILKHATYIDVEVTEPKNERVEKLLKEGKDIVIVERPTDMQYRVRIKQSCDGEALANWIDNNPDQVKVSDTVRNSLRGHRYWGEYYFYVKDENAITLMLLAVNNPARVVERLVYRGDIET